MENVTDKISTLKLTNVRLFILGKASHYPFKKGGVLNITNRKCAKKQNDRIIRTAIYRYIYDC